MDSLAGFVSDERDVLYIRGYRKGLRMAKEATDRKYVVNLLTKSDLTDEVIANVIEVSLEFVLSIKADLAKKKAKPRRNATALQ